jgi:hypothetical protein
MQGKFEIWRLLIGIYLEFVIWVFGISVTLQIAKRVQKFLYMLGMANGFCYIRLTILQSYPLDPLDQLTKEIASGFSRRRPMIERI